jgi:huntingtin-interacting protein 1-related protein
MADEIQTFKALITIHKVLQEGHPKVLKEANANTSWLDSLARGVNGEGIRGKFIPAVRSDSIMYQILLYNQN